MSRNVFRSKLPSSSPPDVCTPLQLVDIHPGVILDSGQSMFKLSAKKCLLDQLLPVFPSN